MLNLFEKRIGGLIKKHGNKLRAQFKKLTNVKKLSKKLFKAVYAGLMGLLAKPQSVRDYIKTGTTYIAKKLVALVIVVALLFLYLLNWVLLPWAEGRLWIPEIVINTSKYHAYSGEARVVQADGTLIYAGKMQEGRISGEGSLYDQDGLLLYRGGFAQEKYQGSGERYDREGRLLYGGEFADNLYHGEGQLFAAGVLQYEGEFRHGEFHGQGHLYEKGETVYEGAFQSGEFHGEGRLYNTGQLLYEGQFQNGLFHGEGNKYHSNGILKYRGNFALGAKNGEGKLYSRDGQLLYQGSFLDGSYDGAGKKYSTQSGRLLYAGEFSQGLYYGLGALYDEELGRLLYDGHFKEGLYGGQGTLYNWKGQDIYSGYFYQGEIDYLKYLDQPVDLIREDFGNEDKVHFLEYHFLLDYAALQVLFSLDYPEVEMPSVNKIIFLGEQEIAGGRSGIPMAELSGLFGESYSGFYYLVDEEKRAVLAKLGLDTHVKSLYSVRYILKDESFIRFYTLEAQGEVLYFEVGGL